MSSSTRILLKGIHNLKLAEGGLQANYPVYKYVRRRIQSKQLPFYQELINFVNQNKQISVRHFYYHCFSAPLTMNLPQVQRALKGKRQSWNLYQKIDDLVVHAREYGLIPLDCILDDSDLEWTPQYDFSIVDYLKGISTHYRSDWFANQKAYVEVWCEKRAMSKLLEEVTDPLGIPLIVSGKYPSLSQVKSSVDRIVDICFRNHLTNTFILYCGDLDPTGKHMIEFIDDTFRMLNIPNVHIIEVAVNPSQVTQYNLPPFFPKQKDPRLRWFIQQYHTKDCVEIEALDPNDMKRILEAEIYQVLDATAIGVNQARDRKAILDVQKYLSQSISSSEDDIETKKDD